jgi:hypothetical protein
MLDLIDTLAALEMDNDAFTAAMRDECCADFHDDDTAATRAALYRAIRFAGE